MTDDERAELIDIIAESIGDYLGMVGRGERPADITWRGAAELAADRLESRQFYYLPSVLRKEAK